MARRSYHTRVLRAMLLLLLCGMLASCAHTQEANAAITLDVAHPMVGPVQVDVRLSDSNGQPVSGATVQLRGDMTHAGMPPVLVNMDDLGNGQYRAADFQFTMAGNWVLTVDAALPSGMHVERMFEVRGVKE